ncbi:MULTISPECIES: HNH endonuclease signature motif containing protein [unclassified Variovorax]|uniref:HNH endonuclease n=1 Tax=unclassified Variovorax TaxID=663243 RepID=UPI001E2EAB4D|nr:MULTISPECIES: HNH endonuclease signature motif containing protein [unclassified Variovorax]
MAWSRTSRHARGYGTAWDKLRAQVLERDHHVCRCSECEKAGRVRPATEVDHRIPKAKGGTDDPSNLCAINKGLPQAQDVGRERQAPEASDRTRRLAGRCVGGPSVFRQ